jgi:hypothetical protein
MGHPSSQYPIEPTQKAHKNHNKAQVNYSKNPIWNSLGSQVELGENITKYVILALHADV